MTTDPLVIWEGADGRTHAAVSRSVLTLCRDDTESMVLREGNPIVSGIDCPACVARITGAMIDIARIVRELGKEWSDDDALREIRTIPGNKLDDCDKFHCNAQGYCDCEPVDD